MTLPNSTELAPRRRPARLMWVVLLLASCALSTLALVRFSRETTAAQGWLPYLLAAATFMAAVHAFPTLQVPHRQLPPLGKQAIVALVLILVAAAGVRLYALGTLPSGTWWDEADIGLVARKILAEANFRPFFVVSNDHPLHHFALVALSFRLFGESTAAVRLISALFGILAILAAFLAGRESAGTRFGLVFAFLLTFSRWHITFSRFGLYTSSVACFMLFTIWFLLRGRRRMAATDFAWAGMTLGFGLDFYMAFRLFAAATVVGVTGWAMIRLWRNARHLRQQTLVGLTAFVLAFLVPAGPMIQFAVQRPEIFWGRARVVSIFEHRDEPNLALALAQNTVRHVLMFNVAGDRNGRHNLPGAPMLDRVTGTFFLVGLAIAIIHCRRPRNLFLIALLGLTLSAGIMTLDFEAPQANRAFGSIVPALWFAALAIVALWDRCGQVLRGPAQRYLLNGFIAVLIAAPIAATNVVTYFRVQVTDNQVWADFSGVESCAARRIDAALRPHTKLLISLFLADHPTIRFLAPRAGNPPHIEPPFGLPIVENDGRDVVIVVERDSFWIVREAKRFYPEARYEVDFDPAGHPVVTTISIPRAALEQLHGITARYWRPTAACCPPALSRAEVAFDRKWPDDAPLAPPFVTEWTATLWAEREGDYAFALTTPGVASFSIDGISGAERSGLVLVRATLARGNHELRLESSSGTGVVSLTWATPLDGPKTVASFQPVPGNVLFLPERVPASGLLGAYFQGPSLARKPALRRIDPFIDMYIHHIPLARPYSVEWSGMVEAPMAGTYQFGLDVRGSAALALDGRTIVQVAEPTEHATGNVALEAGWHSLRLRFVDDLGSSRIHLLWTPPGGDESVVPSERLRPFIGIAAASEVSTFVRGLWPDREALEGSAPGR